MTHQVYKLAMMYTKNRIVLDYDPVRMLSRMPDCEELNAEQYAEMLEHLKDRIDWCIRKSAALANGQIEYTQWEIRPDIEAHLVDK
jgi:hypothetical protein